MNEKYKQIADDTINHIWSEKNSTYTEYITKLTKYYPPGKIQFNLEDFTPNKNYKIIVERITSLEAIFKYINNDGVILNFASAKNPGGGFLRGTIAQEESLARSSNLYPTLLENDNFYKGNIPPYYNDKIIYSPGILFFKDDYGNYVNEKSCSVITCAAPNLTGGNFDLKKVKSEFLNRIEKVFQVALLNAEENIILGAWGCGVFRNPPEMVSECFKIMLNKYQDYFKTIIFAIPDDKFDIFRNVIL